MITISARPARAVLLAAALALSVLPAITASQAAAAVPVPTSTIGVYDPHSQVFYLRTSNTAGVATIQFRYGTSGDVPLAGDWNGDGSTTIGVYRPSTRTFLLRNANSSGSATVSVGYGAVGDVPIVGDWDGNGTTTIGVYRPSTGQFYLRNSNTAGTADVTVTFGSHTVRRFYRPLTGDWDGNGTTTVGLFLPSIDTFFLRDANSAGPADFTFHYGRPAQIAVIGDWDGNDSQTVSTFDPANDTFYLHNANSAGSANSVFRFGTGPQDIPLAGRWVA